MFGYVLPQKSEMKVKDFDAYRAYYCGVCKQLQKSYGVFSRFLLNYDLVLLAVMADALSGARAEVRCEGCFANPLARRKTCHNTEGLALAADGLVMLSYHKLCDNLADEKFFKRVGYTLLKPILKRMYKKAAAKRPALAEVLVAQMQCQQALEAAGCQSADEAADPTAKMCEALFMQAAYAEEEQYLLGRVGLFAGQIVYLLDAAEDYDDDAKDGSYNVFIKAGLEKQEAVEAAKRRCHMAAGEIALCYNRLPIKQNKDILDNIFFLGLPAGIAAAGVKRRGRKPKHGEIDRV